jgi:hypothetical protein
MSRSLGFRTNQKKDQNRQVQAVHHRSHPGLLGPLLVRITRFQRKSLNLQVISHRPTTYEMLSSTVQDLREVVEGLHLEV